MLDPKFFDDISQRVNQSLPPGLRQLQGELDKTFRASLQSMLAKLDLVTREEFDVQQAVLARTRARLEALEQQVAELEVRLNTTPQPNHASSPPTD